MDNIERLKYLLERFYDGNSTLDEEAELSDLLLNADLPKEFKFDKELFASLVSASEPVEVPGDLNQKIISLIDEEAKTESRTRRINLFSISALAAGLLLILSVYLVFLRDQSQDYVTEYSVEDPVKAYEETRKALDLISEKWNTGTAELKNLDEVNKGIRKSVQPMQKLNSGSKEIKLLGNLKKAEGIKLQ